MAKTHTDKHREVFARWLAEDDTVVCTFENQDLGHPDIGARISMPFSAADAASMTIGTSRAPDTTSLIGWRYILAATATTVEQALINQRTEEEPKP